MSIASDRERLLQKHNLELLQCGPKMTEMITVYRSDSLKVKTDHYVFSGLLPCDQVEKIFSDKQHISDGVENVGVKPMAYCPPGENDVRYFRWGVDENIYGSEPLVIGRQFSEIKESYFEISEEFRLFHNLYHDRETDTYIKIDDAGDETTVAIVKSNEVQIRLKEIRQFLAVKEMYLSLLFEFNVYSRYSLEELGLSEFEQCDFKHKGLMCWTYDRWNIPVQKFQSISRLRARKLIEPLPKSKSSFGDFAGEPKYVKFIVDVDENGDEVYHTCDPYKLDDHLGENSDAASKYTIVHFRKQVLDKYSIGEPTKYYVRDSMVGCGLWSMKIDDDHPDKVCVFLRELCNLPYSEQIYWRSYNIPPEGGVSESFYRRMIQGEWVNSSQPDILFKQSYEQLQKASEECLGWQLLKPLDSGDEYRFQRLRIPVNDEQCHFDDLVQDLQTILIESINVKPLKRLLPAAEKANLKCKGSIEILKETLNFHSVEGADHRVSFLQKLQALRSEGSSHRKGRGYQKIANYFGLDSLGQQEAFAEILKQALDTVDFLTSVVRSRKLKNKNDRS
ncbi:MAG: hypothetical protein OXN27_13795 [Candidatus Poribacteria bacterium]|nr:hypothetical protein [Candidatus Poribacteria bacterium]